VRWIVGSTARRRRYSPDGGTSRCAPSEEAAQGRGDRDGGSRREDRNVGSTASRRRYSRVLVTALRMFWKIGLSNYIIV